MHASARRRQEGLARRRAARQAVHALAARAGLGHSDGLAEGSSGVCPPGSVSAPSQRSLQVRSVEEGLVGVPVLLGPMLLPVDGCCDDHGAAAAWVSAGDKRAPSSI